MDNIKLLKNLGFTEYESRTYLALADLGPSTAREISNYSKLPRNKTYEMLKQLEKKNKIVVLPLSPKKYKVSDLSQLDDIVKKKKKKLNKIEEKVGEFIEESSKPKLNEFKEIFWVIRGKKAIIKRMVAQNSKTKKEILSINRLSIALPKNLRIMRESIEKGVNVKMLVPVDEENKKNIKKWQSVGVDFRNYNESKYGPIGTRISVFDKKIVRITFGEPDVNREEDYITLWAQSPYLANILRNYFTHIWKNSREI